MRLLLAVCVGLLTAPVWAEPSSVRVRLDCFDAWKGGNLREAGGGPGGAQWNTETVVCTARLDSVESAEVHSVRLKLQVGQGKTLALVAESFSPAHPRQMLAMGEVPPGVEAIATVAANKPSFFIPASVFTSALRQKSRQADTGANVYRVRFLVTATGLDIKGRPLTTARDELQVEFAFGE